VAGSAKIRDVGATDVLDRFGRPEASPLDPCPACGFAGAGMKPGDLEAALATLPRRWKVLLAAEDADGGLLAALDPPGRSGAAATAWAGAALDGLADALDALGGSAPEPTDDPKALGAAIEAAVSAVAAALRAQPRWPEEHRDAVVAGVHAGSHGLRPAQAAVDAVLEADDAG